MVYPTSGKYSQNGAAWQVLQRCHILATLQTYTVYTVGHILLPLLPSLTLNLTTSPQMSSSSTAARPASSAAAGAVCSRLCCSCCPPEPPPAAASPPLSLLPLLTLAF